MTEISKFTQTNTVERAINLHYDDNHGQHGEYRIEVCSTGSPAGLRTYYYEQRGDAWYRLGDVPAAHGKHSVDAIAHMATSTLAQYLRERIEPRQFKPGKLSSEILTDGGAQ